MAKRPAALALFLAACGPIITGGPPDGGQRADAGGGVDAGPLDGGWSFIGIPGSQCARGAQAGIGYAPGASDELVVFLQGGGACWNNGTCQPSLFRWGPVCNYGADALCLWDQAGGTKPLAVNVDLVDPYPADGGGVFPSDLATLQQSLLFARRAENPFRAASWVFVPYCTGDLHAGNATRTYSVKADAFSQPMPRVHHFVGATNLDAYLTWLRARHPSVRTVWLVGVSAGGYGASLNLKRVRQAFPEATVHLLADSAPMVATPLFREFNAEWNVQVPSGCTGCDAGLPSIMQYQLDDAPDSRVALLAFSEDQVITRFMYSEGTTAGWLSPPYSTYTANLVQVEGWYEPRSNARYFRLAGQDHVMLQRYGTVLGDGGITPAAASPDGGTTLKQWVDAWASGQGAWQSQK